MPNTPRCKFRCRARIQTTPAPARFNVDRNSGTYLLTSSDGRKDYLLEEPMHGPVLNVPSILTLLTTGTPKIILCAPPTIVVIELGDLTRPLDFFGYVTPRTVAAMQEQGWLRGDGVFQLTDEGAAAAPRQPEHVSSQTIERLTLPPITPPGDRPPLTKGNTRHARQQDKSASRQPLRQTQ